MTRSRDMTVMGASLGGADGLRATEAAGGLSVVQEPEEAVDPSMPRNASLGHHPDDRVPLDALAESPTRPATGFARPTS